MKTVLGASLIFALMSSVALAQPTPPAGGDPPPAQPQDTAHPAPPPPPQAGRDADDDGEMDGARGHEARWPHHRPPPPSKAARFRVEAGDITLGMKCPEDEPLKACQDFALQLLDKAGSVATRR